MIPDLRWASAASAGDAGKAGRSPVQKQRMEALVNLSAELESRARISQAITAPGREVLSSEKNEAEVVRAFLDASAVVCGALEGCGNTPGAGLGSLAPALAAALPAEAVAACSRVRELLLLRPLVARAVREFLGGLLYLVLTAAPREEDMHSWTARPRLMAFVQVLCDPAAVNDKATASAPCGCGSVAASRDDVGRDAALKQICPECACRHIAIQEALSLVRYLHRFSRQEAGSQDGSAGPKHLPAHLEDGLWPLLRALRDWVVALHPSCYSTMHEADGQRQSCFAWRALFLEVAQLSGTQGEGWQPFATAPLLGHAMASLSTAFKELEHAVGSLPTHVQPNLDSRGATANRQLRQVPGYEPGFGFGSFPAPLSAAG